MNKIFLLNIIVALNLLQAKAQTINQQTHADSSRGKKPETMPAIATDRPDQTESPFLVPTGRFQIETGYWVENDKYGSTKTINRAFNTTLFKAGISSQVELRLIAEYLGSDNYDQKSEKKISAAKGMNSIAVGAKIFLFEERGLRPKTSLITHLQLPYFGTKEYRPSYVAPRFRFLMQHTLSERFSFSYNLGGEWDGNTKNTTGIYTMSLGIVLTKHLGMFVESYGFLTENSGPGDRFNGTFTNDHRFDSGFTYLLRNNLQLDISGGIGLSPNSPNNFMSCGISWRFKN